MLFLYLNYNVNKFIKVKSQDLKTRKTLKHFRDNILMSNQNTNIDKKILE